MKEEISKLVEKVSKELNEKNITHLVIVINSDAESYNYCRINNQDEAFLLSKGIISFVNTTKLPLTIGFNPDFVDTMINFMVSEEEKNSKPS